MTSIELTRELHQRGLLSKEAALRTLRAREKLIKQAMLKQARDLWRNLEKCASAGEILSGLLHKDKPGFFSRFRGGGFTGGGHSVEPGGTPWSDVGANLLKMLGVATLSAGATAGASAILKHRADKSLANDIQSSYKGMFSEFPRLSEMEPDKVKTYFGILAKFAPSLAADPIVAGSFVQDKVAMGQIDQATIKGLAETQNKIDEMHESRSPFSDHFDRGIQIANKSMSGGRSGGKSSET